MDVTGEGLTHSFNLTEKRFIFKLGSRSYLACFLTYKQILYKPFRRHSIFNTIWVMFVRKAF